MLSLGKLGAGPGAGRYYVDQVALGAEDYYAGEGDAAGQWVGTGATELGLQGDIGEREIVRLLEARNPASGDDLRRTVTRGAVAGFDLTFRAPKSVSVVFGIADGRVREELRIAHDVAVQEALGYLEREACLARRGAGGAVQLQGHGFIGAAFEHRASRAGDPLLHTHVVVANATQGPDGRWTALDGRALYRHAKTAGFLYQAALRSQVAERLGLRWGRPVNGVADLEVVPRAVIEHFSQRRAEIVDHMAARGEHSARAAQVATLETRRAKRHVPLGRLRAEWMARAAEHGFTQRELGRIRPRSRRPMPSFEVERVARELEGSRGLTRHRSTFTRRDVLQTLAESARDGASVTTIEERADAFLGRDTVVELVAAAGERRFTTRELLALEVAVLDAAERRTRSSTAVADTNALEAALATRSTLSEEQRRLVEALTRGGRGVEVVRAAAGTGKTFALDAAREAWQRSDIPVLGCALSARAASELRDQAGVDATTNARLTQAIERGATLAPGSVLLVDEAGMVGTRDLARLAKAAEAADAKLVLVGDDRQLPEIEAGGLFAALGRRLGAIELHEVRRQENGWDRNALHALREGDVDRFARTYADRGRVVVAPTAEHARERLVGDWLEAEKRGGDAVMLAHRRRDVAELNQRARECLRALGRIGPDQLHTARWGFAVGDRVVARRNDRRLGVINGDAGRLTAIDAGRLNLELGDGRNLELPAAYAHAGHLDHGYALTAHLAQGSTVDRAFVLGSDELYREWGYTALSRHRVEARFYVSCTPEFLNQAPEPLQLGADAGGAVARMLAASRAQRLALDSGSAGAPGGRPAVSRGIDPLAGLHVWPERPRRIKRDRGLGIER